MAKLTKADEQAIRDAYQKKVEEYKKYTSEELKKIYEESKTDKKKRIGGIHRVAFLDVLTVKLQEENLKAAIEETKSEIKEENQLKE